MPLLSVSANDVDTAGVSIDAELPVHWLDEELREAEVRGQVPGRIQARLSRTGNEIIVRGRVKAKVSTPCARCLDPAPIDVDTELSLLLHPAPQLHAAAAAKGKPKEPPKAGKGNDRPVARRGSKDAEHEFSAKEADADTYDGETVILDGFVREAILLEMPNFPLCSEACPGIPPSSGAPSWSGTPLRGSQSARADASRGTPINPRLLPLRALKAKLGQAEPAAARTGPTGKAEAPRLKTHKAKPKPKPTKKKKRPAKQ